MTPHKQLFLHDPDNGVWGDCYRTAFACLLDIEPERVPHFCHEGVPAEIANGLLGEWLKRRRLTYFQVLYPGEYGLKEILTTMENVNPDVYYILGGKSKSGVAHVVICCNDEIVHDPSRNNNGIVGPDEGYYWITVLIPIRLKREGLDR